MSTTTNNRSTTIVMDEHCSSNEKRHGEESKAELTKRDSYLNRLIPETRTLLDDISPEARALFEKSASLEERKMADGLRFTSNGVNVHLGRAGMAVAVLGMAAFAVVNESGDDRTRKAEHEAERARRAQEQERLAREEAERKAKLERKLRELGIPLDREIREIDINKARIKAGYKEGFINIVLVGNRGMGKSTLVNSLRGLGPGAPGRAEVGETETTLSQAQYIDQRHGIVWYDVPGAGTDKTSAWQYYYDQSLFVFDKIVLVHDTTLTESDLRILKLCKYRNQECIVVRSKADMHVRNRARRMGLSISTARKGYISEVRQDTINSDVRNNTGSPKELVLSVADYIVSEMGVLQLITNSTPSTDPAEQIIDEVPFLKKLGLLSQNHNMVN